MIYGQKTVHKWKGGEIYSHLRMSALSFDNDLKFANMSHKSTWLDTHWPNRRSWPIVLDNGRETQNMWELLHKMVRENEVNQYKLSDYRLHV